MSLKSFCQEKKDTIFFDEDWSICEKPVAEYYRVCTLNKDRTIFYKGNAEDYYIDGKIEMKGHYADNGYKDGEFIFYKKDGGIIKQGKYKNDEMNGDWSYYDSTGKTRAIFNCESSTEFTPVFLINHNNDTILNKGNGKFLFDVQNDMKEMISGLGGEFEVEGEVIDSLKNGEFNYYMPQFQEKPKATEIYKKGKFIRGKSYSGLPINTPLKLLTLNNYPLDKTDVFYHSNLVFGSGTQGDQQAVNLLVNNISPQLVFISKSFADNNRIIFEAIGNVLRKSLSNASNTRVTYDYPPNEKLNMYYRFMSDKSARDIKGKIVITIDTSGNIINSAFETNLNKMEINKINYYLSRIEGLKPYEKEGEKALANIDIELNSINKNFGNRTMYIYEAYNNDAVNSQDIANYNLQNMDTSSVQIEAKFPGGQDAWRMFLERNLNNQVPADRGAPPGNYTVTISFLVDKEGNISEVQALTNPGYGTAEEAVRVIKKGPKWVPAFQYGRNVIYRQKQNITFQVTRQ